MKMQNPVIGTSCETKVGLAQSTTGSTQTVQISAKPATTTCAREQNLGDQNDPTDSPDAPEAKRILGKPVFSVNSGPLNEK